MLCAQPMACRNSRRASWCATSSQLTRLPSISGQTTSSCGLMGSKLRLMAQFLSGAPSCLHLACLTTKPPGGDVKVGTFCTSWQQQSKPLVPCANGMSDGDYHQWHMTLAVFKTKKQSEMWQPSAASRSCGLKLCSSHRCIHAYIVPVVV